jgi:hypothetical protein
VSYTSTLKVKTGEVEIEIIKEVDSFEAKGFKLDYIREILTEMKKAHEGLYSDSKE